MQCTRTRCHINVPLPFSLISFRKEKRQHLTWESGSRWDLFNREEQCSLSFKHLLGSEQILSLGAVWKEYYPRSVFDQVRPLRRLEGTGMNIRNSCVVKKKHELYAKLS